MIRDLILMFYKGWAIWMSPAGFVAYERVDSATPGKSGFNNVVEAMSYVDAIIAGRR